MFLVWIVYASLSKTPLTSLVTLTFISDVEGTDSPRLLYREILAKNFAD
jgi:hypothetical protein